MSEAYRSPSSTAEKAEPFRLGGRILYAHTAVCPALEERLAREDTERLRAGVLSRLRKQANLPEDASPADLEKFGELYRLDEENELVLMMLRRFAASCSPKETPACGLTILGPYGVGKTTLAIALVRTLVQRGVPARFENVPELMDSLKGALQNRTLAERIGQLQEFPVLVLDDLGRERPSAFTVDDVLYTVIGYRDRAGLPTVVTTNFTQHELEARYDSAGSVRGEAAVNGGAIVERLRQKCPWVELSGESRRQPTLDY